MLKGGSSATKRRWPRRCMMSIDVIFPYGVNLGPKLWWIHGHSTHYQQGTLGKFKISFWRTSQCVSYSVGIVTWRIAGGANSPYYRHCAGIVNRDQKTHQFADGSWANGSKKSCKSATFSVNVAVAEFLSPKLLFLEYLNYDILWDPTPTQDSKNPPGFFDETFFSAPDFRTGMRSLSTLVGHYRTSQDIL